MKNLSILLYIVIVQSIASCSKSKQTLQSSDTIIKEAEIEIADSISLSTNSNVFHAVISDAKNFKTNRITTIELPRLKVHLTDSLGNLINTITTNGEAPGLLGSAKLAVSQIGESGRIYVVTTGNDYKLFIYENDGEFIGSIPLFKYIEDQYAVFKSKSAFIVVEESSGITRVVLSSESVVNLTSSVDFYRNTDALLVFDIDVENISLIDSKTEIPFKSLDQIKRAISKREISWSTPSPNLEYYNNHYFLSFPFFKGILIYDSDFSLVEKILFNSYEENARFNIKMNGKILDQLGTSIQRMRLLRENMNVANIQVADSLVLIQYPEVFQKDSYPLPNEGSIGRVTSLNYGFKQIVMILDLKNGQQYQTILPEEHYDITLIDRQTLLIETQSSLQEDKFVLKGRLILEN